MKKMILAVALLLTGIVSAQADGREKPITIDNLPKAAGISRYVFQGSDRSLCG